jgi:hypothetical protein
MASADVSHLRAFLAERESQVPLPEQQIRFLELVSDGMRVDAAAMEVGSTASRFRGLARRSPDFREAYDLARDERARVHRGKIRRRLDELAFGEDAGALAALRMQAEMYLPELEHKRTKVIHHGNDGTPFRIQAVLPQVTQEALDALPLQDLERLVETLRQLAAGEVEELRALGTGSSP